MMHRHILIDRVSTGPSFRLPMTEAEILRLMLDIGANGQVVPIKVMRDRSRWFWRIRPWRWIVLDGHRRLEAMKLSGCKTIEARIVEATIENGLLFWKKP